MVAGLLHLHSLGILHRDLRAANLLIGSLDPLHVLLTDFGVSHLLSAFAAGAHAVDLTASKLPSVVTGVAALGPLQVRLACSVCTKRYVCVVVVVEGGGEAAARPVRASIR